MVTWASVAPDVDGLGIVADWLTRNSSHSLNWWGDYHHILAHNLGFALIIAVFTAILAKQSFKTTFLVLLSFHLHLLADLVGARGPDGEQWPIPYLMPFMKEVQLTWSGQWALNAWPNFVITAVLIGIAFILAHGRSFSPLEMFSSKADANFVRALRARFPLKTST